MINRNAPTVSQTVTAGDAKITLDYTSIAFGQGQAFNAAMDKANGAEARQNINELAKKKPIGTFTTNVAVEIGTLKLPAGEYKLGFTINDACEWQINFTGKETMTMKLPLMDMKDMQHKRLLCSLYAGDDSGAGIYVAFGNKAGMLTVKPGGGGGEKKAGY